MQLGKSLILASALLASALPALAYAPRVRRGPTSPKLFKERTPVPKIKPRSKGQAQIDPERAREIQTALIKSGYLSGEPSGVWDTQTESAMQKLQGDNGWQTKLVPDARAIIKLGLGPNHDTSATDLASTPATPAEGSPAAESGNTPVPANQ